MIEHPASTGELVDRIYADLNKLEKAIDGESASVEQTTLAKLREIYLRAKRRGDERLYAQAFRVYNRLLNLQEAQQQRSDEYAEKFARYIVNIVLKVMQETDWLEDRTAEDVAKLAVWLTEILQADFEERVIFEP